MSPPNVLIPEHAAAWTLQQWYAVYTRSRHEKIAAEELQSKQIQVYLPCRRIERQWSDRVKLIDEPLFPGYVFVNVSLSDRWNVLKSRGVVKFIGASAASPTPVLDSEITTLRKFFQEDIQVDPYPYLREGQKVYVRSGPFKGVEGFVVRKSSVSRLVISLDILMQSVSIEINPALLECL